MRVAEKELHGVPARTNPNSPDLSLDVHLAHAASHSMSWSLAFLRKMSTSTQVHPKRDRASATSPARLLPANRWRHRWATLGRRVAGLPRGSARSPWSAGLAVMRGCSSRRSRSLRSTSSWAQLRQRRSPAAPGWSPLGASPSSSCQRLPPRPPRFFEPPPLPPPLPPPFFSLWCCSRLWVLRHSGHWCA